MSKLTIAANIAQQKTMLAEKYERLVKCISSKPRRSAISVRLPHTAARRPALPARLKASKPSLPSSSRLFPRRFRFGRCFGDGGL